MTTKRRLRSRWIAAIGLFALAATSLRAEELRPAREWTRERAGHLLRRAGFGGSPSDVERLFSLGRDRAVDSLVYYSSIPQTHPAFRLPDAPDMMELQRKIESLPEDERRDVRQQLRSVNHAQLEDLRAWWAERMLLTPRPFEEKMTLFWHGHFTTGAEEVKATRMLAEQNALLRTKATGPFRDLLRAICRDRAMLRYLNSDTNRKEKPNENFARELFELFTLGTGNYTEQDIKESARAFTGYSVGREGFQFRRGQHDFGEKTILGRTGKFDGDDVVEIILQQPQTSRFLAARLLKFFVVDQPPKALVEALASKLRATDFDIGASLAVLFRSEQFYTAEFMHTRIKSPPELVIGMARALGITDADCHAMAFAMRSMGQELFQPPNVKGWDGGRAWITTATLFSRYDYGGMTLVGTPEGAFNRRAKRLEELAQIKADLRDAIGKDLEALRAEPRIANVRQPPLDPRRLLNGKPDWTNAAVVDHLIVRLVQGPIPGDQRADLLERLGPADGMFDPAASGAEVRLKGLLADIMLLPEFQLN